MPLDALPRTAPQPANRPAPVPSAGAGWSGADVAWAGVALLLLLGQIWFPTFGGGATDTHSVDPFGKRLFYELMTGDAEYVVRQTGSLAEPFNLPDPDFDKLILLGPLRFPRPREWDALLVWVSDGGTLILAAPYDAPRLDVPGADFGVEPLDAPLAMPVTMDPGLDASQRDLHSRLLTDETLDWRVQGRIKGKNYTGLAELRGEVVAAVKGHGAGRIVLIASDDLFTNVRLPRQDNVELAVALVRYGGPADGLFFDESLNETGTPRAVEQLLGPDLRPLTLQVTLLLVLFGWLGARRFGPLLPPEVPPRRDLSDHTQALGALYLRNRAGREMLRATFDAWLAALRVKPTVVKHPADLESAARRLKLDPDQLRELLTAVQRDLDGAQPVSTRRAAEHIRALTALRAARGERR